MNCGLYEANASPLPTQLRTVSQCRAFRFSEDQCPASILFAKLYLVDAIIIRGAREHNLKNISLEIPRNRLVVITGVSGSGKSSLAFDTLYAEGRRRYVESLSAYARQFLDQRAKPEVDAIEGLSPAIAIEQRGTTTSPRSTVGTATEISDYLRLLYARVGTPYCLECGRAIIRHSVPQIVDQVLDLPEGSRVQILAPIKLKQVANLRGVLQELHQAGFIRVRIDGMPYELSEEIALPRQPPSSIDLVVDRLVVRSGIARRLADSLETALRYGHDVVKILVGDNEERLFTQRLVCPTCGFAYPELTPAFFSPNSPEGACPACDGLGVQTSKKREKGKTSSASKSKVGNAHPTVEGEEASAERLICSVCEGTRVRRESRVVRIQERDIAQVSALSINAAEDFFHALSFRGQQAQIAQPLCQEILARLRFLLDVGLDYLTLDRPAATLSGGEAQRIRLATQIGAGLSGVLYVLDEPSIGLHQRDTARLLTALQQLRDRGNAVVVVEHDRETILAADYVIDLGPGAGEHGGELLAAGTPQEVMQAAASLTGRYLRGELAIPLPIRRRQATQWLTLAGVSVHNLKNVTVSLPLGTLTCVTGVSGSGKSTLVMDVLSPLLSHLLTRSRPVPNLPGQISGWEPLDKVICVDQAPISRTPHSNPATYIGLFNALRDLFAQLPEARVRGYGAERFSFNVKGGRCEACEGDGVAVIAMHFLPDVYVVCDVCHGTRYTRETLEVQFRGKNIAQVLDLTVNEALEFLGDIPTIRPRLETLRNVGLEYLRLGQPAPTLSGGEAQRLKLAKELSRKSSGRTLYILDEPTTGLHFADIHRLLQVLGLLVEAGNSVLVIEHNLDVIKTADYLIDLGPEGGEQGGEVIAAGTPEEVALVERSYTGHFLRPLLGG
ncbi:MAG: excinuclease ABC subunit UvrA [Deltaproteobacteria bacterium]|nr:excinuclease ABC subunit UvrA [Deltaproteobacteria bacterium]